MKKYFILVFATLSLVGYSQENSEWFELGSNWVYNWNNPFDPDQSDFTYSYSVTEITVFLGKICSKIEADEEHFECLVEAPPYYMYHSNDTVYYATEQMSEFGVGYVLSESAQWQYETSVNDISISFNANVEEVSSVEINGNEIPSYSVFYEEVTELGFVEIFPSERTVIRQIGDPNMFIIPFGKNGACDLESGVVLRCFTSPSLIYENPDFNSCTLGIEDIRKSDFGLIYPNPAYDAIRWDDSFQSLTIYDVTGKVVLQNTQAFNTQSLDVRDLNSGFYTVVVEKENTLFSQKLVIER